MKSKIRVFVLKNYLVLYISFHLFMKNKMSQKNQNMFICYVSLRFDAKVLVCADSFELSNESFTTYTFNLK